MDKQERRRYRVKFAFWLALISLTLFTSTSKQGDELLKWIMFQAWASYLGMFATAYLLYPLWQLLGNSFRQDPMFKPAKSTRRYWVAAITIFLLLLSPTLFKNQILDMAVRWQTEQKREVTAVMKDGTTIKYYIPGLYIIDEHNTDEDSVTFTVTSNNMQPLALISDQYKRKDRHTIVPEDHPQVIHITLLGIGAHMDEAANRAFLDKMLTVEQQIEEHQQYDLPLHRVRARVKNEGEKEVSIGQPLDEDSTNQLIMCGLMNNTCQMTANSYPEAFLLVTFHESRLPEWKTISEKAITLVQGFVVK